MDRRTFLTSLLGGCAATLIPAGVLAAERRETILERCLRTLLERKAKRLRQEAKTIHYGDIYGSGSGNFYSPELSDDFLSLPTTLHEDWKTYRIFGLKEESCPFVRTEAR